MKIQLLSDLHLERQPDFVPEPAPGADVLVLAGDIGSYQHGSLLDDADFGLGRFSPRLRPGAWKTVLYVPGNHEYDALDFDDTHVRLRDTCERLGIVWLEREVLLLDGVRFLGTTLWTDFEALVEPEGAAPLARRIKQRDKAYRAANFYLRRYTTLRNGVPLLAQDLRELGLACQQWLRAELERPCDGPTVVVTHFAPSLRSADPRYGLVPGTAGFCNALDDLLPAAQWWLHGHLHCPNDYLASGTANGVAWQCRVVANPLGYAMKDEQQDFIADRCVDIG